MWCEGPARKREVANEREIRAAEKVGPRSAGGVCDRMVVISFAGWPYGLSPDNDSCDCVRFSGGCGAAPEWQGGRSGRRVWRHGLTDRVRSTRVGYGALES